MNHKKITVNISGRELMHLIGQGASCRLPIQAKVNIEVSKLLAAAGIPMRQNLFGADPSCCSGFLSWRFYEFEKSWEFIWTDDEKLASEGRKP